MKEYIKNTSLSKRHTLTERARCEDERSVMVEIFQLLMVLLISFLTSEKHFPLKWLAFS